MQGLLRKIGLLAAAFAVSPGLRAQAAEPAGSAASAAAASPAAASAPATSAPAASAPAASAPRPAASPASAPRSAAPGSGQRIEITGGRESDTEARRRSTAAKIVIGREEIEKFGDATVGEVLRRLPGVTTPGAPGRGGPPRLRGLGSGYTQLLIDGQRVPPGFSLESLTPEQIERIEIQRAPTAETGARAIAGTINIITREGFRRRLNDLRIGTGYENGAFTPGAFWTRNDSVGELIYNVSLGVFKPHRINDNTTDTTLARSDTGAPVSGSSAVSTSEERRTGVNLTTRLQWRLNQTGDSLVLQPSLFGSEGRSERRFASASTDSTPGLTIYEGAGATDSRFANLRVNGQWRQRFTPALRMELGGYAGGWKSDSDTTREQTGTRGLLVTDDLAHVRERSGLLTAKFIGIAGGGAAPAAGAPPNEHNLVGGLEAEAVSRDEARRYTENGTIIDLGDTFSARTLRLAGYLQDEWNLDAHWAFHAGLRWEGIGTRGDAGATAGTGGAQPENRSSVTTPLMHLLWKPDPAKRDQVRLSLTRSYRAPSTQNLIARPALTRDVAVNEENSATSPDRIGNPELKPERAIGLDLAFERYLDGGGLLSANAFYRHIKDLMRGVVTQEAVPWSTALRWVERQRNIGNAVTMGLELEAKYRLDQLIGDAPRVELRHNLALMRSRVDGIPGPDNRLDQQAKLSANIGADYRPRGVPLTLGGNLNWVPGYRTQLADDRAVTVSGKRVFDAFVLWTLDPALGIRLLANNVAPREYTNTNTLEFSEAGVPLTQTARSHGPSYTNWQLRLELKL